MPIREVVRIARPHGIEVIVDGAHAFAHFPFKRDDLGADARPDGRNGLFAFMRHAIGLRHASEALRQG